MFCLSLFVRALDGESREIEREREKKKERKGKRKKGAGERGGVERKIE